MKTKIVLAIAATLLAGCSPDTPPQAVYQPPVSAPVQAPQQYAQPAPVVVQQAAAPAHSGMQDMLVGGAIGALATNALSNRSAPAAPAPVVKTRVIERTVIVRQAPRPAMTAPAPRPRLSPTPPRKVSLTKRK